MGKIKDFFSHIFRKKYANTFGLTGKGLYLFSYIARKYMNEEDIDAIETYEESIRNCEANLNNIGFFQHLQELNPNLPSGPVPEHGFAAIMVASLIFKAIREEDKQKCLEMITNQEARDSFLGAQDTNFFDFYDWSKTSEGHQFWYIHNGKVRIEYSFNLKFYNKTHEI